jgi:N,N-dimethylformamidase beta subunit-like, C-terminal
MTARLVVVLVIVTSLPCLPLAESSGLPAASPSDDVELEGIEPGDTKLVPTVQAAFERESYHPGERARLVVRHRSKGVTAQVFESGPERVPTLTDTEMNGVAVTRERPLGRVAGRRVVTVPIRRRWRSGLYFVRLRAADGRLGFAPFALAPRRIGRHRVAVVLPTLTWQAYNFRDDDGDGKPDTWYAGKQENTVRLGRAFLDRGVPYGFRNHLGFLNWLHWTHRKADYLSQLDLEQVASSAALARAYDLIVFPGHHEYVTKREYDLVEGYRDLGGNLVFLSANNFFWRVERKDDLIVKSKRWRDLGRPEARLIGVQYVGHQRSPRGSWVVRRTPASRWMFAGTDLGIGSSFARGGVEIDQVSGASPRNVRVIAEIPHLFGPGMKAQMTYYETGRGARVFAAGAFHLTRAVTSDPAVWRMLANLWKRMVSR